jgi:NAD(P)-dependent dehydrogenase (short-subunit alcohol dehydrogenase family)
MELDGAAAIVTGGASGIGAATVAALRRHGARVVVLDVQEAPDADLFIACNVEHDEALVAAIERAVGELGGLDVAIVNAGVGGFAPILDLDVDEWDRVIAVNLRAAFLTIRECARAMVARHTAGVIVTVTSISAFLVERGMAPYSVSKAGLAQLTRVAARELGTHGIRVNAVAPGTTDTPLFGATDQMPGYRDRVSSRTALGRVGRADEVAEVIVALCTLDWVTGQIVAADGGVSLASPIDPSDRNG